MPKRVKSQTCSKGWCSNHVFELQPKAKKGFLNKRFRMRLCPHFNNDQNKFFKSIPIPNKDNKFYTPTFILQDEQKFYEQYGQRFLIRHLEKAQQNESGNSEMLVPKHCPCKNYCNVCKQMYDDYLQHISQKGHKDNINSNIYTKYVKQLEAKYKNSRNTVPMKKKKQIKIDNEQSNDEYPDFEGLGFKHNVTKNTCFQSQIA